MLGRALGGRVPAGLLVMVIATTTMALFLDLTAIASIGSAVALTLFTLVTISHLRVGKTTGASLLILLGPGPHGDVAPPEVLRPVRRTCRESRCGCNRVDFPLRRRLLTMTP